MSPLLQTTLKVLRLLLLLVGLEVLDGIRAEGTGGIRVGATNVEDAVSLPGEERADEEITTVIRRGVWGGFPEREEGS